MTSWTRRITAIAAASALAVGVAACGDDNSSSSTGAGDGTTVKIADKQFTESAIVAQAYAAGLRTQGFDAQVKQKAVEPGIGDRPPCEQAGMPETSTNRGDDVECREQLGGVIKSMHRKAA